MFVSVLFNGLNLVLAFYNLKKIFLGFGSAFKMFPSALPPKYNYKHVDFYSFVVVVIL